MHEGFGEFIKQVVKERVKGKKYITRKEMLSIVRACEKAYSYESSWGLFKQMVDYYSKEKKYLTVHEVDYIIGVCKGD